MNDNKKRFCEEYVVTLNGSKSAINAGYSESTARQKAYELLGEDEVQEYISQLQQNKSEELNITQNKVLQELCKIAFGDVKNYFDDMGRLIDINELENQVSASIKSVTVQQEKSQAQGEVFIESTIKKIESYDKLKAIDTINKMLGFYSKDNEQKKGDSQVTIFQLPSNGR